MVYVDNNGDQMVQPTELRTVGCTTSECTLPFLPCTATADCQDGYFCTDDECVTIDGQGYCSVTIHDCADTDPCTIDLCINNVGETNGEVGSCDNFNNCP